MDTRSSHQQSGRTTRMIQYALAQTVPVTLVALSQPHASALQAHVIEQARSTGVSHDHVSISRYYYGAHRDISNWKITNQLGSPNMVLYDHSVLERLLANVIQYLASSSVDLISVANLLSSLGKAVYLILDPSKVAYAKERTARGVFVETEGSLPEFDLMTLRQPSAHPNCVFLVDPNVLLHKWDKALWEMDRWNLPAVTALSQPLGVVRRGCCASCHQKLYDGTPNARHCRTAGCPLAGCIQ